MVVRLIVFFATALTAVEPASAELPGGANLSLPLFQVAQEEARQPRPLRSDTETESRRSRADMDLPTLDAAQLGDTPRIRWRASRAVDAIWKKTKDIKGLQQQLRFVTKKHLLAYVSNDLVPITALADAFQRNLRRRDHYRDRIFASPLLVALLERASELLAERSPGTIITVGDIAQAGGGQIRFGTKVELLRDGPLRQPVRQFVERADLRFGRLESVEQVDPHEAFPIEKSRFSEFQDPVLLERSLVAVDTTDPEHLCGRFETRRFYSDDPIEGRSLKRYWSRVRRALRGHPVERVASKQGPEPLYRASYVSGSELIEVIAHKRPSRRARLEDLVELRRSRLSHKKPGVRVRENRYFPERAPNGELRLAVWREIYEATHVTHMGGLDADLSYAADETKYQFTREISHYDYETSRLWLRTLYDAAEELSIGIDRILIDPRVRWRLNRGMPKEERKHPVWELVRSSRGHDSHLHLRLLGGRAAIAKSDGDLP